MGGRELDKTIFHLTRLINLIQNNKIEKSLPFEALSTNPVLVESLYRALKTAYEEVIEKSVSIEDIRKARRLYPIPNADDQVYSDLIKSNKTFWRLKKLGYNTMAAEYVSNLTLDEIANLFKLISAVRAKALYRETLQRELAKP
ncbi:MAG: hypothetical protein QXT58_02475 [Archaeoglobaceae archaeon]